VRYTADLMHWLDILLALSLLVWGLVSFRNLTHRIHRIHTAVGLYSLNQVDP
jgi:hypothetical protein